MKLINLEQYRRSEVVADLKGLLAAAEAGHIQGLVYVAEVAAQEQRAGIIGAYRRSPERALQATFALERYLRSDIDPIASPAG